MQTPIKQCCSRYYHYAIPKVRFQTELHSEVHPCPTCNQQLKIFFKRIDFLGGEIRFIPLKAEPV